MVLRRIGEKLVFLLTRRKLVGTDSFGNKYFVQQEKGMGGELVEKRLVKYPSGGAFQYDPTKISPEWHQWLSNTREDIPDSTVLGGQVKESNDTRLPRKEGTKETIRTPMGSLDH